MEINSTDELLKNFHVLKMSVSREFEDGAKYVFIDVKGKKPRRSTVQNSFYWKNMTELANFLTESGIYKKVEKFGVVKEKPMTKDDMHDENKDLFGIDKPSKLNKKEFSIYMEKVFHHWSIQTNGFWQPLEDTRSYFEKNGYKINENGEVEL